MDWWSQLGWPLWAQTSPIYGAGGDTVPRHRKLLRGGATGHKYCQAGAPQRKEQCRETRGWRRLGRRGLVSTAPCGTRHRPHLPSLTRHTNQEANESSLHPSSCLLNARSHPNCRQSKLQASVQNAP